VIVVIANGLSMGDNIVESNMMAATFLCKNCTIKFQLIGLFSSNKYVSKPAQLHLLTSETF
jgi:hypothetical protein